MRLKSVKLYRTRSSTKVKMNNTSNNKRTKKRFSIRKKLLIIFGFLILFSGTILSLLAVNITKKAIIEKIEIHLVDKASDTAEIIDGRITAFFQFLEGIARAPILTDSSASYAEKSEYLKKETSFHPDILELNIADMRGNRHTNNGSIIKIDDRDWYKSSSAGKKFLSEPIFSRTGTHRLIAVFAVPIYDHNRTIVGVLAANVEASWLANSINDIVIGETGECYILGLTGTTIAYKDMKSDAEDDHIQYNTAEEAKTDPSLASVAAFERRALAETTSSVIIYEFQGVPEIGCFAKIKSTGWTVIIQAPVNEFMGGGIGFTEINVCYWRNYFDCSSYNYLYNCR